MKGKGKMTRKLDALVAEWIEKYECVCDEEAADCPIHAYDDHDTLLPYSTDIAAAWRMVDKMFEHPDQGVYLAFRHHLSLTGHVSPSHLMSRRICVAVLRAVGVPEAEIQGALDADTA